MLWLYVTFILVDDMTETEGWNIAKLHLPLFGELMIAFKGDEIRIRKADAKAKFYLKPISFTFPRSKEQENIEAELWAEIDI